MALPWNNDEQNLNAGDFFDPRLLLAAPVSLFKYPLSYAIKSPIFGALLLALVCWDLGGGGVVVPPSSEPTDYSYYYYSSNTELLLDVVGNLLAFALETALFARVFLKELLAERNEILARSILDQCVLYSQQNKDEQQKRRRQQQKEQPSIGSWLPFWKATPTTAPSNDGIVYAPGSVVPAAAPPPTSGGRRRFVVWGKGGGGNSKQQQQPQEHQEEEKAVVAILGMAHCNGIMKLLKEQRI